VPVANGVAYYWDSIVLKRRSTAAEQHQPVADGLRSILDAGVLVLAVVSDNEAVNTALYDRLLADFSFLIHIPCAAHTIQLCVERAMELPAVIETCSALDALLMAFKKNKIIRIALKTMQASLRQGKRPLQLISYVCTRWSSKLRAAERILLLKDCIQPLIPQIVTVLARMKDDNLHRLTFCEHSFWQPLRNLIDFLKPFQVATDIVQADCSTLMDVYHQFIHLVQHAEGLIVPQTLAGLCYPVRTIIREQWDDHVNVNVVVTCAVFSFDSNLDTVFTSDTLNSAMDWFFSWASKFVLFYGLSEADNTGEIEGILFNQYSMFKGCQGIFSNIRRYKDSFQQQQMQQTQQQQQQHEQQHTGRTLHSRWDARPLWNLYRDTAKELTACALALLSITASEAAVERTFSKQGLLHSKTRNSLGEDTLQAEMFVAFNRRALENVDPQAGAWVELADDDEVSYTTKAFLSRLADSDISEAPNGQLVNEEQAVRGRQAEGKDEKSEEKDAEMEAPEDEKEDKEREPPTDAVKAFIQKYVEDHHVTSRYRWGNDKMNSLQAAIIAAGLYDVAEVMKQKIRAHVAPTSV